MNSKIFSASLAALVICVLTTVSRTTFAQIKMSSFIAEELAQPAKRAVVPTKIKVLQRDYKERIENLGDMKPVLIQVDGVHQGDDESLQISDIADSNGDILLFRLIRAKKYIKGFYNRRNIMELGQYAYSANPRICQMWGNAESLVLISIQNIKKDILRYPNISRIGNDSPAAWSTLKAETKLGDISVYDEIDVLIQLENVLVVIPSWACDVYLENYWHRGQTQKEIVLGMLGMSRKLPSIEDAKKSIKPLSP